jgi:hypothetical protein
MNRSVPYDSLVHILNNPPTSQRRNKSKSCETDWRYPRDMAPANITQRKRRVKLHMLPISTRCTSVAVNLGREKGNKRLCQKCSVLPFGFLQTQARLSSVSTLHTLLSAPTISSLPPTSLSLPTASVGSRWSSKRGISFPGIGDPC